MKNTNIRELAKDLIDEATLTMSKFQIKNFIINDQLTDYKKIKQCLLELRTRYEVLKDLEEELELKQIDIDENEYKLKTTEDQFERRRLEVEKKKLQRQLKTIKDREENVLYEIEALEEYLQELIDKLGIDKVKEILKNQEDYEPEYWIEKFARSAYADLLSSGRISEGLIEALSNIDKKYQAEVIRKGLERFIHTSHNLNLLQNDIKMNLIEDKNES